MSPYRGGTSLYVGTDEGSLVPSGRPLRPEDTGAGDPVRRVAPRPKRRSRGVSKGPQGACIQGRSTRVQGRGTGQDGASWEVPMSSHEMTSHEMTNHEMTSHEMTSHEMIGIDIAACELAVIGERVTLEPTYENTPAGRQALVKALRRSKRPVRVVMEATGIYFLDVACDLADAGFEVMVVNPRVAHHFAEAILQRRKDDPTDAAMLQEYGRRMTFVPWVPPRAEVLALRALTREVQAQTKATAAAKNRLHALRATRLTPASLLRALERQIARAEALIDELMTAAVALVEADPELAQRFGRIDGIPGFGAKATVTVMGELVTLPRMSAC